MQLSKKALIAVIALPAALGVAVLLVWYDMNTPPSFSEYSDSAKTTQEVQSFLTVYPNATAVEINYLADDRLYPASPIPPSAIEYSYFERPKVEENTARAISLTVRFEAGMPTYFVVSCYDQLRDDSQARIEGASLSNITAFLQNKNCPLNLRTSD